MAPDGGSGRWALFVGVIVVVDPWSKPEQATNDEHDAERSHKFEHGLVLLQNFCQSASNKVCGSMLQSHQWRQRASDVATLHQRAWSPEGQVLDPEMTALALRAPVPII